MLRVLPALAVSLSLVACAAMERPDSDPSNHAATFGAVPLFDGAKRPLVPPPGATIEGKEVQAAGVNSRELTVLAISGGGSDGAFGAGVLRGWTESGQRPEFDIVTGVSTGALIASFAFLGPGGDDAIERFYTRTTEESIFTPKGIAGLFDQSLYDTTPLRRMIERVIDAALLTKVAEEHRRGRRLYVATTDLDSGTLVVWDMGGIAAGNHPRRLDSYRDVLVASAAFPAFFEPVYVRRSTGKGPARMHVDGGVKAPILLRSFMVAGPQPRKRVYMLVNGKLSLDSEQKPVAASVLDISKRSITELMRGLTYKTIYQGYVTTRRAGGELRILYVPDDVVDIADPLRFEPGEMRRLFDVGRRLGRDPASWAQEPPRLEPLERIEAARPVQRVREPARP